MDKNTNHPPHYSEDVPVISIKTLALYYEEPKTQSNSTHFLLDSEEIVETMANLKRGDLIKLTEDNLKLSKSLGFRIEEPVEIILPFKFKGYETTEAFNKKRKFKVGFDCYFKANCFYL